MQLWSVNKQTGIHLIREKWKQRNLTYIDDAQRLFSIFKNISKFLTVGPCKQFNYDI